MYSQEELEELCSLRKPDGLPLGIGHVYQLIQVGGRGERKRLQKDAAKNCWSSRKLKAERMQKRGYKVPTNVGRKQWRPTNLEDALVQIAQHADRWLRWADALTTSLPGDYQPVQLTLGDFPDSVRDKLMAVTNAIKDLSVTLQRLNVRKRNSQQALRKKKRLRTGLCCRAIWRCLGLPHSSFPFSNRCHWLLWQLPQKCSERLRLVPLNFWPHRVHQDQAATELPCRL